MPANDERRGSSQRDGSGGAMGSAVARRIYAIEAWCLGCKRCEVACRVAHSETGDPVKAYNHEAGLAPSRITVEGDAFLSIAVNCRHCDHPRCVEGCISGAMGKDPVTGTVTSDPARCVGCRTCVSMCPFGAVKVVRAGLRDKALKCDLCGMSPEDGGMALPSCVEACPNRALVYLESEVA